MQRLSDEQLLVLLNDIESDRTERKGSFSDSKKIRQAVCAFANDLPNHNKPGVLFIGAKDDGSPSGESITDELLLNLAAIRTNGTIQPMPVLTVEKRLLKGAEMAVVTVIPSDMPPVRYDGRIWVRTGPSRSIANEQEERILNERRRYKNIPYDLYPMPHAKISDLSRVFFEEEYLSAAFAGDVLEANHRTYEERLSSCKMIVAPSEPTPTVLGILTLGNRPQDFLFGSYVQFLRIDGIKLSDPVSDELMASGRLSEVINQTMQKFAIHNKTAYDIISAPTHIITKDYPQAALEQIFYNAVLHRDYERGNAPILIYWFNDRVEFHSPGGPYGDVTVSNFARPGIVSYRNPNIADVMKSLGFVQRFGRGIQTANDEMFRNGNPPPEFIVEQTSVACVLRGKK
ncbi:MAG: putative DNA binding domain-containing protein [Spirochaetales bacterium]|jgi:ATP-dependent DNA helicase RecG|nr:putative DNA binding domain-containing protein [Spirochaetales bacterium]